jgi:hypothetical protein
MAIPAWGQTSIASLATYRFDAQHVACVEACVLLVTVWIAFADRAVS